MTNFYSIPDVPIEIALHVAKMVNSSPNPLSLNSIIKGMKEFAKDTYTRRGIGIAIQLGMIELTSDNAYKRISLRVSWFKIFSIFF